MLKMFRRIPMAVSKILGWPEHDDQWSKVTFLMSMAGWRNDKDLSSIAFEGYPNITHSTDSEIGSGTVCLDFGGNARAVFPGSYGNMGNSDFTIEAFVKVRNNTTGSRTILGTRNGPGNSGFNILIDANRKVKFNYFTQNDDYAGAIYSVLSTLALTYETWYHIALVRIGTTVTMYIDGAPQGTMNTHNQPMYDMVGNGYIGGHNYSGAFDTTTSWIGKITNIRITKGIGRYPSAFTSFKKLFPAQA